MVSMLLALVLAAAQEAPSAPAPSSPTSARAAEAPALDAMLADFAYPHPVERHDFRSQDQDLSLAYMDVKPERPNGRAVLLLHGKNFSGAYWERTIDALVGQGYRVVAPDQIGFGKSTKPRPYHYSLAQMAEQTRGVLDQLGLERTSVVGHSMGGMLALRYALQYPDAVEKLVLVNSIGLEDWKRHVPYRSVDALYRQELAAPVDAARKYMREVYFAGDWKPEYEPLVALQEGWARGPDRDLIAWTSAVTTEMLIAQPVVYEFPDVRAPTLLVIGQRDRTALGKGWASEAAKAKLGDYPSLGRAAAEAIPNATLVALDDVGHVPQVEAWDAYWNALSRFLGDAPSASDAERAD